jgi:hypothetical protein
VISRNVIFPVLQNITCIFLIINPSRKYCSSNFYNIYFHRVMFTAQHLYNKVDVEIIAQHYTLCNKIENNFHVNFVVQQTLSSPLHFYCFLHNPKCQVLPSYLLWVLIVLANARIVCNIVCASARSNPQGNGQILVSCLINLILT